MREIGRDGHRVYSDIEETIAEVYLSKIADLRDAMKPYDQRYSSVLLCISDIWQAQLCTAQQNSDIDIHSL